MEVGSCWGMKGSKGKLSVQFAHQIYPESITLDHIQPDLAMDFSSAPKQFHLTVYS